MEKRFPLKLSTRLLVFLSVLALGLIVATVAIGLVADRGMMLMLTLQDILLFIAPAVVTMMILYRRPCHAMAMDLVPTWKALLVVVAFYVVSIPAMNWLVTANEAMSLPAALSGVEHWMRTMEDSAAETTRQILDIHTVGGLIACVLVVGVMAGLSEEFLFRGAMLRMMQDSRMNVHVVVWIVAIIFSAFHMQFYGFFPRMILGLWLGYLLVWTGSLWVPIIAHALNNSTVVVFNYLSNVGILPEGYGDNIGLAPDGSFPWLALLSALLSFALALWAGRWLPMHGKTEPDRRNDSSPIG